MLNNWILRRRIISVSSATTTTAIVGRFQFLVNCNQCQMELSQDVISFDAGVIFSMRFAHILTHLSMVSFVFTIKSTFFRVSYPVLRGSWLKFRIRINTEAVFSRSLYGNSECFTILTPMVDDSGLNVSSSSFSLHGQKNCFILGKTGIFVTP